MVQKLQCGRGVWQVNQRTRRNAWNSKMMLCFYADSNHQEYKFLISHWPLLLELGLACPRGKLSHRHSTGGGGSRGEGVGDLEGFLSGDQLQIHLTHRLESRNESSEIYKFSQPFSPYFISRKLKPEKVSALPKFIQQVSKGAGARILTTSFYMTQILPFQAHTSQGKP